MYKITFFLILLALDIHATNISKYIPKGINCNFSDCSEFIQSAVDNEIDLNMGDGVYLIKTPIYLRKNNQNIYGNAEFLVKSKFALVINSKTENLSIRNLTFKNLGSKLGGYDNSVCIFSIKKKHIGIKNSLFDNLNIEGFGIGLNLKSLNESNKTTNIIKNCYIHDTLSVKRIGSGGGHAIYTQGKYWKILNNKIENMQGGILGPKYGKIENNIILNAFEDNGLYLAKGERLVVINNYIENVKADGIALNKAKYVNVYNNIIKNAGNGCIRIQESHDINISSNTCLSNYRTNHFIRGYAKKGKVASSSININSNRFIGPLTGKGNSIIFRKAKTAYSNINISDNYFRNVNTQKIVRKQGKHALINIQNSFQSKKPFNCQVKNNFFERMNLKRKDKKSLFIGIDIEMNNFFQGFKGEKQHENINNK